MNKFPEMCNRRVVEKIARMSFLFFFFYCCLNIQVLLTGFTVVGGASDSQVQTQVGKKMEFAWLLMTQR